MSAFSERSSTGALRYSTNLSNEIASLDNEADPELQRVGRLRLAGRIESRNPQLASQLYSTLTSDLVSDEVALEAGKRLATLQGQGSFGGRAEQLLRQVSGSVLDPKLLIPMLAGSMAFSATRALVGARLASAGLWWGRGFSGRVISAGIAFGAEVPTFALLQRQMHSSPSSLGEDLIRSGLSLGLLKTSTLALAAPLRKVAGQAVLPHAVGGLGLFAANVIEQRLGLRPSTGALTALVESFANYFSLSAGMQFGRKLLGENFQRWESGLALRMRQQTSLPLLHLPLEGAVPDAAASAIFTPKGQAPLLMTGSGGGGKGNGRKVQNRSISPGEAKKRSAEQQARFMDPKLEPPSRWQALEEFRKIHPQLADTKDFGRLQKQLLRLVANPGLGGKALKNKGSSEAVAYYGFQNHLRGTAAELYVQGLERSSFSEPLVERGAQILRKVLENPKIDKAYRPDPRDTDALDYYRQQEATMRTKLFPLYTRLLFRLPKGSLEARKGIEMLSRADWLHRFENGKEQGELRASPAMVGQAYAYLLDAASAEQLAAIRETRGHLVQWLPHLETLARHGSREALRAMALAGRHEKPAQLALQNLQRNLPRMKKDISELELFLIQRDQRRIEDAKRLPYRSERAKLLDKISYYLREWFWFWH